MYDTGRSSCAPAHRRSQVLSDSGQGLLEDRAAPLLIPPLSGVRRRPYSLKCRPTDPPRLTTGGTAT